MKNVREELIDANYGLWMEQEAAKRGGKAGVHPEGVEGAGNPGAGEGGGGAGGEARGGDAPDVGEGTEVMPSFEYKAPDDGIYIAEDED